MEARWCEDTLWEQCRLGLGSANIALRNSLQAGLYSLGDCEVRWAFILAIIATCDGFILGEKLQLRLRNWTNLSSSSHFSASVGQFSSRDDLSDWQLGVFQEVWPWLWPSQSLSAEIITTETSAPRTTWSTPPRGTAGDTSTATATSALPPTPSVYTAAASPGCTWVRTERRTGSRPTPGAPWAVPGITTTTWFFSSLVRSTSTYQSAISLIKV